METKETSDIGLFAALLACGATFLDADRSDPKHIVFKVGMLSESAYPNTLTLGGTAYPLQVKSADKLNLKDIEAEWINETLKVNAVTYFNALRRAKSIVHSR